MITFAEIIYICEETYYLPFFKINLNTSFKIKMLLQNEFLQMIYVVLLNSIIHNLFMYIQRAVYKQIRSR